MCELCVLNCVCISFFLTTWCQTASVIFSVVKLQVVIMAPIIKKHTFLTIDKKKEILTKLAQGKSLRQLAVEYDVGKSTISDIKLSGIKIDT